MSFKGVIGIAAKQPSIPSLFTRNQENLTHESVCVKWNMTQMLFILFLKKYLMCWKLSIQHCKNVSVLVIVLVPSFGLNAEWNFVGTSNGKSSYDGIGGTVKCIVGNANLWSSQEPINTLSKMFEYCRENTNAIEFIFLYCNKTGLYCGLWFRRKVPHLVKSAWNKKFLLV